MSMKGVQTHKMISDKEAAEIMSQKKPSDEDLLRCKYKFKMDARSITRNRNRPKPGGMPHNHVR